jgi:enoyl-CoA hydratase/carnithine racemase
MIPAEPREIEYSLSRAGSVHLLRLESADGTNRLTRKRVEALTKAIESLDTSSPLIITGNHRFFSAGADLNEILQLSGASAVKFAKMGQRLMHCISDYPGHTIAAISGYCMGGGLDLALACDLRIAAPNAIFGHRGAALGIMTGWGGTQRLPRLIGRARALQTFLTAEKLHAPEALRIGLIDRIADDALSASLDLAREITAV